MAPLVLAPQDLEISSVRHDWRSVAVFGALATVGSWLEKSGAAVPNRITVHNHFVQGIGPDDAQIDAAYAVSNLVNAYFSSPPDFASDASAAVADAASAAQAWDFDLWPEVRFQLKHGGSIWKDKIPHSFQQVWQKGQSGLMSGYSWEDHATSHPDSLNWSEEDQMIWVHWYNRILLGQNWHPELMEPLLRKIRLQDWIRGASHINPMFFDIVKIYLNEVSLDLHPKLAQAYPVDFTFDTLQRVMRMIGIDDNMRHLRDPSIVQAFLDDAEQLRDDFKDFVDYASELAPGGNYAGVLRRASEKVIREFERVENQTHLRAERLVQLGGELELFASSEKGRDDLGDPLATVLDTRIDALKQLCRKHFGPSYQTLAPLAELSVDQVDQEGVLHVLDEAIRFIETLPKGDFQPLDHEGLLVLNDMRDELRTYRAAIAEASSDDFRELLEDRFAQSAGSLGLSLLRFGQKSKGALDRAGQGVDVAIQTHGRLEGLGDIIRALKVAFLSGGG
ncbi:hypothetical protein ACEWPN_19985 [Yoonia sp. R2-816]